ncbi:GtrA family protein [Phaeodactylibacter luteus]|uniref:GtrA family protein n=1 Tax=Phaeodactylibacter luteus TaxID=1564516 RepID=A0A5C6S1B5_9BACT|nr:GtrA family protein [Phaeodactylibacter luteus]TXB68408.1 GtrA family protein [Phaeodactylibacter luteus]
MKLNKETLLQLFKMKLRFAMTGAVATAVDYFLYLGLVHADWQPVYANMVSYSCGAVLNFLMQKRFVFQLQGSGARAFALSLLVSGGGLILSTSIVYGLSQIPFLNENQYLLKLIATGLVFLYNFYLKRYVFERKFI